MGAVDLYTALADRGARLTLDPDGGLHLAPRELFTPADLAAIHRHRTELLDLAALAPSERCSACPRGLEVFDPSGTPFCDVHCPESERWQLTHADRVIEAHERDETPPLPGAPR